MSQRTPEQHWTSSFAAFERELGGGEPAWIHAVRKSALACFAELGFPTRKQEAWKYTNVAPIAKLPFRRAGPPRRTPVASDLERLCLPLDTASRLVFVNGRLSADLTSLDGLDPRVAAGSLAQLLEKDPGSSEPHLTRLARFEEQAFVALNTAFFADGAFLRVPRGVDLEQPLFLIFLTLPSTEPTATHPRVLVVAEEGSRTRLVEVHASLADGSYFTNAVTEIVVGENAGVEHLKLQCECLQAFHVTTIHASQERASRFTSHSVSLGAALARTDVVAALAAEGVECALNGLYVTAGRQHVDHRTTIDHQKPHGTSRELYKGILAGASRGVFNGNIRVRPDAQQTDARQRNDNLLLSAGADIHTKPQLEIHANDVKCSHGSTIGHLDDDALFYLRSRGLDASAAREILTRGFAAEVIREVQVDRLREPLAGLIIDRLFGGGADEECT